MNTRSAGLLRILLICLGLGVFTFGLARWREASWDDRSRELAAPIIEKRPAQFTQRSFDPDRPPAEMPPLTVGEDAECDSDFTSDTSVAGETKRDDDTHGTVTITQVKMSLGLNVTIWVPNGVSQQISEHEEGHREISEFYYQSADKLAQRIAKKYLGKKVAVSGSDLNSAVGNLLKQLAKQINDDYTRELDPGPTQNYYDGLTNHSRNEISSREAASEALKNVTIQ